MYIKPCGNRVLLVLDKPELKTAGGIVLPQTAPRMGKLVKATIKEVGPGEQVHGHIADGISIRRIETGFRAGDRVLIGQFHFTTLEDEGLEALADAGDIIAIIKE